MTNPTYEVNHEKLSSLSIADLISLENKFATTESNNKYETEANFMSRELAGIFAAELDKRINDIIIF